MLYIVYLLYFLHLNLIQLFLLFTQILCSNALFYINFQTLKHYCSIIVQYSDYRDIHIPGILIPLSTTVYESVNIIQVQDLPTVVLA
jgi:hypothetical protein